MQLQREARRTLHSTNAVGTFENLNTQWVMFLEFCVYFELTPFPASTILCLVRSVSQPALEGTCQHSVLFIRSKNVACIFKLQYNRLPWISFEDDTQRFMSD